MMSKATTKLLGTIVAFVMLIGGLVLQSLPAGAGPKAAGGGGGGGITTEGKAFDYRSLKPKLTKVKYDDNEIDRFKMKVPMSRGDLGACPNPNPEEPCDVSVHVEVVRPKAVKEYPTILEASPYHGTIADRSGTRIFPGPKAAEIPEWVDSQKQPGGVPADKTLGLAGYFAPRGYAVVFMDLRGTGKSGGCLDHLGAKDRSDMKDTIDWIAKQNWSNGRVGMTGHSYVGSTPSLAASANPNALKTIVPSAGLAAMYHHKFQHGVPYFLQWIGPAEAYEELAITRFFPGELGAAYGDAEGEELEQFFACGLPNSAVMSDGDFEAGVYDDSEPIPWDVPRDSRNGATKAKIPVFAVHGVNDNAARIPALDWFHDRNGRDGDKAWIGQWDHGSNFFPNDRTCGQHVTAVLECPNDQWTLALHAWFDHHLAQTGVNTGPPTELFLNNRTRVYTPATWPPRPQNKATWFYLSDDLAESGLYELKTSEVAADDAGAGFASFVGNASTFNNEASEVNEMGEFALGWDTAPMNKDIILAGIPKMRIHASIADDSATPPHIIGTLYDIAPDGSISCVTLGTGGQRCGISKATFAMNPELRPSTTPGSGTYNEEWAKTIFRPDTRNPVVTGPPCPTPAAPCPHKMQLRTHGMAQVYLLEEDHVLRFVITTAQPDKPPTRATGAVTVYMGGDDYTRIGLPVVKNARIRQDTFYTSGGGDGS